MDADSGTERCNLPAELWNIHATVTTASSSFVRMRYVYCALCPARRRPSQDGTWCQLGISHRNRPLQHSHPHPSTSGTFLVLYAPSIRGTSVLLFSLGCPTSLRVRLLYRFTRPTRLNSCA